MDTEEIAAEGVLESFTAQHSLTNDSLLDPAPLAFVEKLVSLKQREDIAKAAYRTWFRIKPGHREIKDNWWALYYRKILPQYQIRDNHLGRKINGWIQEDMKALQESKQTNPPSTTEGNTNNTNTTQTSESSPQKPTQSEDEDGHYSSSTDDESGDPSKSSSKSQSSTGKDSTTKKRKANSSKEGTLPAYLNVELIQPPKITTDPNQLVPDYVLKTASYCANGDIYWTPESLTEDISWFRRNRDEIMKAIPSISSKMNSLNSVPVGTASILNNNNNAFGVNQVQTSVNAQSGRNTTSKGNGANGASSKKSKKSNNIEISPENPVDIGLHTLDQNHEEIRMFGVPIFMHYDLFRTEDGYIMKFDTPGLTSADYIVNADEANNRISIGGIREEDPERLNNIHVIRDVEKRRPFGTFAIDILMMHPIDFTRIEHNYKEGVLSLRCYFRPTELADLDLTQAKTVQLAPL